METHAELGPPIYWHDAEPGHLQRDLADVHKFAPDLAFTAGPGATPGGVHHGIWSGRLPVWPFDRPEPPGLTDLVNEGLTCEVYYAAAHPMLPPRVYPIAPEPEIIERSQHRWHVAPDGSLCLMQTLGDWDPAPSIVELLEKACGWRIEYALMKAGAIETMTLSGLVSDASLDGLIGRAKGRVAASDGPATSSDQQGQVEDREVRR